MKLGLLVGAFLVICISGGLGIYLDISNTIKSPAFYWALGAITGVISMTMGILSNQ